MPLLRTHWLQGSRKHYHFYKNRNSPSALSFSFVVHIHMILKTIWRAVFFVADVAAVRGEVDSVSVIYVPAEAMAGAQNFGTDGTLVSGAPCPCCHGGRRTPQPVPKQPVHVCNKQHNPSVPPLLPPRPATRHCLYKLFTGWDVGVRRDGDGGSGQAGPATPLAPLVVETHVVAERVLVAVRLETDATRDLRVGCVLVAYVRLEARVRAQ